MNQRFEKRTRKNIKNRPLHKAGGDSVNGRYLMGLLVNPSLLSGRNYLIVFVLALITVIASLAFFRESVRFLFSESSDEMVLVTEEFANGVVGSVDASVSGKPLRSEFGLATAPGSRWHVTWSGECESGAVPFVRLNCFVSPGMKNSIGFRLGDQITTFPINSSTNSELIVASNLNPGATSYSVTFDSELSSAAQNPALALDRIVVGSRIVPRGSLDPNFFLFAWAALTPLILFTLAGAFSHNRVVVFGVTSFGALATITLSGYAPEVMTVLYWILVCVTALVCVLQSRIQATLPTSITSWVYGLVFASLILPLRWDFLMVNSAVALPPDAADYMQIAQSMEHPFDTKHREPLFLWVIKIWMVLTHWSPVMLRCLTLLLAFIQALVVWKLARLFVRPLIAMLIILAVTFNPALIGSSVQGLREELFPLVLLLHAYFGIKYMRTNDDRFFWAFTVFSGFVPLVRLSGLVYVLACAGLVYWRSRPGLKKSITSAAIVLFMIAPMAIYQSAKYGEPFYSSNTYVATFYRNVEFKGKPGFPTTEEVSLNPWAGKPVSMTGYIFGLHPFGEVIAKSFTGAYELLAGTAARHELLRFNPNVSINYQGRTYLPANPPTPAEFVLPVLFLVGLVYIAFLPQGWMLIVLIGLIQLPLSFLVGADLIGWRLTMNAIPAMLIVAGVGLQGILVLLRRAISSNDTPSKVTATKRQSRLS